MIGTVRQVMRRDRKIIRSYVSALRRETHGAAGQPVVIENRGGAGGTAGTVAVVRAAPDGYTLLLTDTSLSISPGLYPNLPYDPVRDLAQISRIAHSPSILLVRPGLGPRTLTALVALAKSAGRVDPPAAANLAPVARDASLPVPRRGEETMTRARSLATSGHLREALSTLDAVRSTDPQRADADRLRGDLQRQLLALTSLPAAVSSDREKTERRNP